MTVRVNVTSIVNSSTPGITPRGVRGVNRSTLTREEEPNSEPVNACGSRKDVDGEG